MKKKRANDLRELKKSYICLKWVKTILKNYKKHSKSFFFFFFFYSLKWWMLNFYLARVFSHSPGTKKTKTKKKLKFIILWVILTVQECLSLCSKCKSLLLSTFYSFEIKLLFQNLILFFSLIQYQLVSHTFLFNMFFDPYSKIIVSDITHSRRTMKRLNNLWGPNIRN